MKIKMDKGDNQKIQAKSKKGEQAWDNNDNNVYDIINVLQIAAYKSTSRFLAQNSGLDVYLLYRLTPKHTLAYQ